MGENIEAIKIYYFNVILLKNFNFHSKKKKKNTKFILYKLCNKFIFGL